MHAVEKKTDLSDGQFFKHCPCPLTKIPLHHCPYPPAWDFRLCPVSVDNQSLEFCGTNKHQQLKDKFVHSYAILHPALSVRRSVGPSHFTFFGFLRFLALPLLPKQSGDLNYGPCPPARDWGSRVSGLVFFIRDQFIRDMRFAKILRTKSENAQAEIQLWPFSKTILYKFFI